MAKIAVSSTDGVLINEHFGKAKLFYIYEVTESDEVKFIELRENTPHCSGTYDHGQIEEAVKLLSDVNVVLTAHIGPTATGILQSTGTSVYTLSGPIDKALNTYAKRRKILENINISPIDQCSPSGGCSSGGCSGGCR
ncbi:MAG TPA: NifB/NifX family molybdenum-iron cluster-binding protein [Pseudobacteroides sp.]|uniref:NifB/NifX family molybdenum-iron cluster-binding protein n=1 Tax=Pseudobacteroides sp. TaxID=1968840 RepID=UPI002F9513F4